MTMLQRLAAIATRPVHVPDDLESVMTTLKNAGIEFQGPIVEDENTRLAFFADPDGNPLYLAQVLHVGAHGGPTA